MSLHRPLIWLRDATIAVVCAVVALPLTAGAMTFGRTTLSDFFVGFCHMSRIEWAFLLGVLAAPAALLGLGAGLVSRYCRGRDAHSALVTGATALGASLLAHGSFYWFLSQVL